MKSLYTILLLGSISIPLVLSFDQKLQFYRQWKYLMPSLLIVALVYIAFDYYLTEQGVWGFNLRYHSGITGLGLPLEEWLFFILIPYASIFLHDAIVLYFNQLKPGRNITTTVSIILIGLSLTVVLLNPEKTYTFYILTSTVVALLLSWFDKSAIISRFYLTFPIILIPFVIVNGILTGSMIDEPVVWYNNEANLGIRFITIPIEDFAYAFSLIFFNLLVRAKLKDLFNKPAHPLL
ncbi:MAG: lycopene cyclase domain-containing protein [Marinilabiliaceae bacterium]|nr:lycopene cyclase domain-containing protein [Marinilabiliaceae bacterium]